MSIGDMFAITTIVALREPCMYYRRVVDSDIELVILAKLANFWETLRVIED